MEALLQKILQVLVLIAESLGASGAMTEANNPRQIAVPNDRPILALAGNRKRTKWQIQNLDPAIDVRYGFTDELTTDRGHRVSRGLGAYVDDAITPYKGNVYVIAEAAGNPLVVVSEEFRV